MRIRHVHSLLKNETVLKVTISRTISGIFFNPAIIDLSSRTRNKANEKFRTKGNGLNYIFAQILTCSVLNCNTCHSSLQRNLLRQINPMLTQQLCKLFSLIFYYDCLKSIGKSSLCDKLSQYQNFNDEIRGFILTPYELPLYPCQLNVVCIK